MRGRWRSSLFPSVERDGLAHRFAGFRPAGRVPFPRGKGTKRRWGTAQDERSALIFALPPDPHYGGYLLGQAENFRRAKMEWLSAIPPGPLGPGFAKIAAVAVPQQRLALPNQHLWCVSAVGAALAAAHRAFPLPGGRWHGEAVTDEGDRQIFPFPISLPPGKGAPVRTLGRMRGTVPVVRAVYSTRRGGTLGRPSPLGSDACRARPPGRAVPVAHRTPQGRPLRSSIGPSPIQRKDGWSLTRRMRVRARTAVPAPGQRTLLQKCHT